MTREEVFSLVREHLAEELEVDAARIGEETRFKEDLDADSLDLYELVMELEDNYGVTVSEEQATHIKTVGDAVGFVEEELVAWGDVSETREAVLAELSREAELVTLIEGDGAPLGGDEVAGLAPDGVELEIERGGQPAYWWLIAAE